MKHTQTEPDNRTLEELSKAGFVEIPRTFPKLVFQTENGRTRIYKFIGLDENQNQIYRRSYDGDSWYVKGLVGKR